jgi:hypothetical protein
MVMYGQEQQPLLPPRLADSGIELAEIPRSGQFPMYSNPPAMFQRIGQFITHHEGASRGHRSFHLEAPRRIVSLGDCLVQSRPGALRDAEDSASRRPRPEYAGKGAVPTLLY